MSPTFAVDEVLGALPAGSVPLVEAVLARARKHRLAVYLVGGPVRDLLLGVEMRDVDLIVEPRGDVDAARLAREAAPDGAKVQTHERFGTASIETAEGEVDLAGLRRERYAHAGALPQVEPGTLEDDLLRRDFTVNALALPLTGAARRKPADVIDPCDGLADLAAKRLRILHEASFKDDPTRALRAARLAPRLGFSLARGTRNALRDALREGVFGKVSGDRFRREVDRCFEDAQLGQNPTEALRRLADWHVLTAIEPGLELPRKAVAPLRRLGRALEVPPWRGPRVRPGGAGLAVWLAEVPPALRRRTLERLAVRGELASRIAGFARARDQWLRQLRGTRGRGGVDGALTEIDEERLYALHAFGEAPVRRRIARWAAEDRYRRAPVTGSDLVELGLDGPAVGKALERIRAAYLDGAVQNREEALALARELAQRRAKASSRKKARGR